MGTGHVMRMIALAQAVLDRGGSATLACVSCPDAIAQRVAREGIEFERIAETHPLGSAADLEETTALARVLGTSWVVLDGYHFSADYQRGLRSAGFKVLAVDDYGHCDVWAADAVLNQNIFAPERKYRSESEHCRFLIGTRFALLRREFRITAESPGADKAKISQRSSPRIQRLLVTLGGVDADNVTGRILAALDSVGADPLEVKLLIGAGNPHAESLQTLVAVSPHSVEVLRDVLDMPRLYQWADGVISAGGGTCWEWLFYHLPAAVVCLADNQRPVIAGLVKHGLALDLGWHADLEPVSTAGKLRNWLTQTQPQPEVPEAVAVDALGAMRVASLLDNTNAWLRPAGAKDARLWFTWANDSSVRANGFHPDPIPWEEHQAWFERHRQSRDSRLWIGCDLDEKPLGYARLHRRDQGEWEVGIAVAPERRGQGVGQRLVKLALRAFSLSIEQATTGDTSTAARAIIARVKPVNSASLKLFQALGFESDAARSTPDCCFLARKLRK